MNVISETTNIITLLLTNHDNRIEQAGAELCQAQGKLKPVWL